jgi:tetratricopeptide (TPR) repeat protein
MRPALVLASAILAISTSVQAQPGGGTQASTSLRAQAFALYEQNRMVEARPLLERLASENPGDVVVLERLGMALLGSAMASDPAERRSMRLKAREVLLRAKELGDDSELLQMVLSALPEDGSELPFSGRKEVEAIMRRAEAAFGRGEMEKAREGYLEALVLEPKQYEAAVFIGDTYYRQGRVTEAGDWFAKAIAINPDVETAYRYWGDTLVRAGRASEARAKYIEGIIANPYNNAPRNALGRLVQQHGLRFNVPQLKPGSSVGDNGGNTTIAVQENVVAEEGKEDGSVAWIGYGIEKATWRTGRFKEEFPAEPTYRNSLKEEAAALAVVARSATDWQKRAAAKTPPGTLRADLAELVRIHQAGLLEAFILLMRPDEGIAKDYTEFRKANRDRLRRYLDEFVVPKIESGVR